MLKEIIKELTAAKDDDHTTNVGMLAWIKRVEVQRAQTAVLNTITELRQFNKVKVVKSQKMTTQEVHQAQNHSDDHANIVADYTAEAMSGIWKDVCRLWQDLTLQECVPQQKRLGG